MTRGTTAMHKSLIAAAVSLACAKVVAADLEEIVVTATRRNQNVSDIPYNITAVNGDELKVAGVVDIATLVQRVPGVSYTDRGARSGAFSSGLGMRGISVEDGRLIGPLNTAPAVATYIDETPLYVNLHLTDIDRVEVLRGPQGTLYGSGSMGGTLRFIHKRPSFSALEASIDANLSQTGNASGVNSELSALINVPLSTTLAVRANLGRSKQAGWIDRPRSYALDPHGIPALANPADYIIARQFSPLPRAQTKRRRPMGAPPSAGNPTSAGAHNSPTIFRKTIRTAIPLKPSTTPTTESMIRHR